VLRFIVNIINIAQNTVLEEYNLWDQIGAPFPRLDGWLAVQEAGQPPGLLS
jgi:hypothetical protein